MVLFFYSYNSKARPFHGVPKLAPIVVKIFLNYHWTLLCDIMSLLCLPPMTIFFTNPFCWWGILLEFVFALLSFNFQHSFRLTFLQQFYLFIEFNFPTFYWVSYFTQLLFELFDQKYKYYFEFFIWNNFQVIFIDIFITIEFLMRRENIVECYSIVYVCVCDFCFCAGTCTSEVCCTLHGPRDLIYLGWRRNGETADTWTQQRWLVGLRSLMEKPQHPWNRKAGPLPVDEKWAVYYIQKPRKKGYYI